MGHASSILDSGGTPAPAGYVVPSFPSLYTPHISTSALDALDTEGIFLYYALDIWQFTLYWLLIFHGVIFCVPGIWFTLVILLSPTSSLSLSRPVEERWRGLRDGPQGESGAREEGELGNGTRKGAKLRKRSGSGRGQNDSTQQEGHELEDMIPSTPPPQTSSHTHFNSDGNNNESRRRTSMGDWWRRGSMGMPRPESSNISHSRGRAFSVLPSTDGTDPNGNRTGIGNGVKNMNVNVDPTSPRKVPTPSAPPTSPTSPPSHPQSHPHPHSHSQSRPRTYSQSFPFSPSPSRSRPRPGPPFYLAYFPFIFFTLWGVGSALVMATIIGFTLSAVYNTAEFRMSTWIPLLCAITESMIVIIS